MKTKIVYIITSLLTVQLSTSQVLYNENFDNYPIGNIGSDVTGVTPGIGGWYIKSINGPFLGVVTPPLAIDYQIVTQVNKGNIAQIAGMYNQGEWQRFLFRTDLNTYWKNRTVGNNILKMSFEIFTGDDGDGIDTSFNMQLLSKEGALLTYTYSVYNSLIGGLVNSNRNDFNIKVVPSFVLNGKTLKLPVDSWVTLECYIDYTNSKIYFSIPSLNYTIVQNVKYALQLADSEYDDSPVELRFYLTKRNLSSSAFAYSPKIDNINISAQNTAPTVTVSVNEVLSNSFNLYPNPANNVVNITNNQNMFVKEVAVYDVTGKLINTQSFNEQAEILLNVEHLASGTYLLHLQTNEGTAVKKLVKK